MSSEPQDVLGRATLPDTHQSPLPKPEREYRLELACGEIALCEWGKSGDEPILLLHGWLDNSASFFSLAPLLAQRYRCIAFDFPGHGYSQHLGTNAQYHFIDGVFAIYCVLEALSLTEITLLGHSMGGALGMLFAAGFPNRVRALVSLEAFGPLVRKADETSSAIAQACVERYARADSRKTIYASIEQALAVRAAAGDLPAPLLRDLVERNLQPVTGGYCWATDARLRLPSLVRMTDEQLADIVAHVQTPVLLVRADKGLSFVGKAYARHGAQLRQCVLIDMEGGHHVHLEQPERVAAETLAFLQAE